MSMSIFVNQLAQADTIIKGDEDISERLDIEEYLKKQEHDRAFQKLRLQVKEANAGIKEKSDKEVKVPRRLTPSVLQTHIKMQKYRQ